MLEFRTTRLEGSALGRRRLDIYAGARQLQCLTDTIGQLMSSTFAATFLA
jgi:hypothetical protein